MALFPAHHPGENIFGRYPAANKKIFLPAIDEMS